MLLVLDIDGLLVERTRKNQEEMKTISQYNTTELMIEYLQGYSVEFETKNYWIRTRKDVRKVLDTLFLHFEVAIWTSSRKHNAQEVLNFILHPWEMEKLVFFWDREYVELDPDFNHEHPEIKEYDTIKSINRIIYHPEVNAKRKWNVDNIRFVDNSENKLRFNPESTRIVLPNFNSSLEEWLCDFIQNLSSV